jgi:hypothetical protein
VARTQLVALQLAEIQAELVALDYLILVQLMLAVAVVQV